MADEIQPIKPPSKGLTADVRPASLEVTGQQRELYPFDAFKYSSSLTGEDDVVGLQDGWTLDGGDLTPGSVETESVASNAITADKVDVDSLFAEDITATGTITGATIIGGSITGESSVSIIDNAGDGTQRSIKIGNDDGMLAQDVNGNVTHDILDKELSSELRYMGHLYAVLPSAGVDLEMIYFHNTAGGSYSVYAPSTVHTVNLPALGIPNIKGIKCIFQSLTSGTGYTIFRAADGSSSLTRITGDITSYYSSGTGIHTQSVDIPVVDGQIKFFYINTSGYYQGELEITGVYI